MPPMPEVSTERRRLPAYLERQLLSRIREEGREERKEEMKITPTKSEFKALVSASEKTDFFCEGKQCKNCFMHEQIDGESCCPVSHIHSIVQKMKDELMEMVLSSLPEK